MQKIGNPVPLFVDLTTGEPLDGGNIYIGEPSGDPYNVPADRITVYKDEALTQALTQPIRTISGFAVDSVTPVFLFIAETDFSMNVRDSNDAQVVYSPSTFTDASAYQSASPVLDAIVANGTPTPFGLSVLLLADVNALKTVLGGLNYIPVTGSSAITGTLARSSAGSFLSWKDNTKLSGDVYVTATGASNPMVNDGDLWMTRA